MWWGGIGRGVWWRLLKARLRGSGILGVADLHIMTETHTRRGLWRTVKQNIDDAQSHRQLLKSSLQETGTSQELIDLQVIS